MSRASAVFGLLLGLTAVGIPLGGEPGLVPGWTLGPGAILIGLSLLALRGSRAAQGLMSLLGLLALGWALTVFLGTGETWPSLPYIILGTVTLGLGVLGLLLDRFQGPGEGGNRGL